MSLSIAIRNWFSTSQSNEWLVVKFAQTKDKKLFEQLYDNCADDLYHFLTTQSDPHLAKDICQKTWLKVIEKPHLYQESGRFIAWLFSIGRNALIDEFRKSNRFTSLPENADQFGFTINHELTTSHHIEQNFESVSDAFDHALLKLPFEQREAFCLQQEGFGLNEIATITHCGVETAKSRIRYAKQALRLTLENYHD